MPHPEEQDPKSPIEILMHMNEISLRLMEAIELGQRSEVRRMLATRGELIEGLESILATEPRPSGDMKAITTELDRFLNMGQWISGHLVKRLDDLKEQRSKNAASLHQARGYRPPVQTHLSTRQLKA